MSDHTHDEDHEQAVAAFMLLLRQWDGIISKHRNHRSVGRALEASKLPVWFAESQWEIPWCMYCGEKAIDWDGIPGKHREDCLAVHLRWLAVAYERLLEQGEEFARLLRQMEGEMTTWDGDESDDITDRNDVLFRDRWIPDSVGRSGSKDGAAK